MMITSRGHASISKDEEVEQSSARGEVKQRDEDPLRRSVLRLVDA